MFCRLYVLYWSELKNEQLGQIRVEMSSQVFEWKMVLEYPRKGLRGSFCLESVQL